jgi:hypothetical protein
MSMTKLSSTEQMQEISTESLAVNQLSEIQLNHAAVLPAIQRSTINACAQIIPKIHFQDANVSATSIRFLLQVIHV